ncbi:MAG TPA: GNAT family protein [Actinomycetota bacterium]|nr:GNAT family protein [Actinomycetota bacterium]
MELRTPTTSIRALRPSDAEELLRLRLRNRDFFRPWEPVPGPGHFTLGGQRLDIECCEDDARVGRAYVFGIFDATDTLVGRVALTSVVRLSWCNANLGYYVARDHNGRGHATDAVRLAVTFAFRDAGLHRVQAGVMPANKPSLRVVDKAGFRREGYAPRYLRIAGRWEDHVLFAVTVEEWTA